MIKADALIHPELPPNVLTLDGIRLRADVAFSDARGREKSGVRKRTEKALRKLQQPLSRLLADDEIVLYVFRCLAPLSALEQYFMGWAVYSTYATTFVVTNKRALHFGVESNGTWRKNLRTLAWESLQQTTVKGWLSRSLNLRLHDGKKQRYWRIKGQDAKKVKMLLPLLLPQGIQPAIASSGTGWTSLCPECFHPLQAQHYLCPSCGLVFKDEKGLRLPLLVIPGGGYFYCRQRSLGVLHAFGEGIFEIYFLIVLIGAVLLATGLEPLKSGEGKYLILAVLWIAVLLGLEKLVAYMHCRRFVRDFIPTDKKDLGAALLAKGASATKL